MSKNLAHLPYVPVVLKGDEAMIIKKDKAYDGSWKRRGGVGAFMMLARKWDRLEKMMEDPPILKAGPNHPNPENHKDYQLYDKYDILGAILHQNFSREDGSVLDQVKDLRTYLCLVEAEAMRMQEEQQCENNPEGSLARRRFMESGEPPQHEAQQTPQDRFVDSGVAGDPGDPEATADPTGVVWKEPQVPRHVVQMLVTDGTNVVFLRRSQEVRSARGVWCPPTGLHDIGETVDTTIRREIKEEVDLSEVQRWELLGQYENIAGDEDATEQYHWVLSVYGVLVPDLNKAVNAEPNKHDIMDIDNLNEVIDNFNVWTEEHKFHPTLNTKLFKLLLKLKTHFLSQNLK